MCPNHKSADDILGKWRDIYATSIADRLNRAAPGAGLTVDDISRLMSLCAFETVAYEKESQFCGIFSIDEFHAYEYEGDLNKYYAYGWVFCGCTVILGLSFISGL